MKNLLLLFAVLTATCAYSQKKGVKSETELQAEVRKAESDFNKLASEKGITAAFYAFADENATIKRRRDTLISGRENIRKYFLKQPANATVTWSPDFIEVSKDGTLAYTYGKYVWTEKDDQGKTTTATGIFHTVWKRQKDGSWKYVWD
ncbi:MAG TPA: DUF4440 domain-containing protein [Flavobacterium sp.]|nr:DUF4440 domain-containing protein [Flavobacterium sp.]